MSALLWKNQRCTWAAESSFLSTNLNVQDFYVFFWLFAFFTNSSVLNLMHNIKALHGTAENGVFLIKPRSLLSGNEKPMKKLGYLFTLNASARFDEHKTYCDPFVLGPALAILTVYGLSCLSVENSSSNSLCQMLSPPVPSPSGSPPCIMNFLMTRWKMVLL